MVKAKTSSEQSAPVVPTSGSKAESSLGVTGSAAAEAAGASGLQPGLTLYSSNYMENLADLCALLMSEYPQKDPFAHERVVVMNMGMRTYLTQRIALQNQISALCDFHQIWQLVYRVFRIMHPSAPEQSLYDREHLTWNVYTLLCKHVVEPMLASVSESAVAVSNEAKGKALAGAGAANATEVAGVAAGNGNAEAVAAADAAGAAKLHDEIFFKLQQYLVDDQFGDKAYELAAKIADALDQYQMYRPQWIQAWNTMPLAVFDDYERDPSDLNNPINIFIEDVCRDLVRRKSGLKQGASVVSSVGSAGAGNGSAGAGSAGGEANAASGVGDVGVDAGQVHSLLQVERGGGQGISAERVNLVRSLFKDNVWQIKLWCLLRHNLNFFGSDRMLLKPDSDSLSWQIQHADRAQIMSSMIRELKSGELDEAIKAKLSERIFVFGVSALPRIVVHFLAALANYSHINVMLMEPCQEYWGDISAANNQDFLSYVKLIKATTQALSKKDEKVAKKLQKHKKIIALPSQAFQRDYKYSDYDQLSGERMTGNPLLLSLGQMGRDNLRLFYELDQVPNNITCFSEPDLGEGFEPFTSSVRTVGEAQGLQREQVEVHGGTLLSYIQRQLLSIEQPQEHYFISPQDQSLQVHVCHTIRREVEVLHDAIKALFVAAKFKGETLYPRDIVVMVPAINEYAPHISAVFGGSYSEKDPDYIPFVISDMTEDQSNTVAQSLLNLLDMSSHLITATTVIDLLSDEAISRRFGLYHDDVAVLSGWLNDNHVCWGLDATDVAEIAEIDIPGTFAKGVDRMLLGTLLGDNQQMPCFSEIQGLDAQLLGKFWDFLRALRELREHFTPELSLTPEQWQDDLDRMLMQRFFAPDEKTQNSLQAVKQLIEKLKVTIEHLYYQPKINLPVFVAALRQGLVAQRRFQPFLREKINFCSLMPMRAVPFKHVFILGLNDNGFPREERTLGFNFLSARDLFECGDRSNNIDDRFLFLEAIMSARQSIYFSYVGRDPKNNNELNPSVVLNELLFYLSDQCAIEGESTLKDDVRQRHVMDRLCMVEHLNAYQSDNFLVVSQANGGSAVAAGASAAVGDAEVSDSAAVAGEGDSAAGAGVGAANAAQAPQTLAQMPWRLPSFNHNFEFPDKGDKQDAAVFGAGVFFSDMSPYFEQKLDLKDLMSFVKKPSSFFMRRLLRVNFSLEDDSSLNWQDESFSLGFTDNNRLLLELLQIPEAERWAYLDRQGQMGRLPYGIFKQEEMYKVMEQLAPLAEVLKQQLHVESLSELKQQASLKKSVWTILLPVAYFAKPQEGEEPVAVANMDELVALSLEPAQGHAEVSGAASAASAAAGEAGAASATADGTGAAAGAAGAAAAVGVEQVMFQGKLQDCYRFKFTLQANYHEQPFVLSTFTNVAANEMGKQKTYDALDSQVNAYAGAFKRSSLVFSALDEALAYYLQYLDRGSKEVPVIDKAGSTYKLAALSAEQLRYIVTALLIFYVLGLSAPVPCCGALLRCVVLDAENNLEVTASDSDSDKAYVNFNYDRDSAYLYGDLYRLVGEPRLASLAKVFLDFYVRKIAPYFVNL